MNDKNIVLCGFMGCGKTTVGEQLRKKTKMPLIDTDAYIEEKQKMTVSEIFEKYGEEHFRDLEHLACRELAEKKGIIISTGGGALTFERNVRVLKKTGTIVLIQVPLEEIKRRLKNDKTRPLLNRPDRDNAIKELFDRRMPVYKAAADIIVSGSASPSQVALNIRGIVK